MPLRRAQGAPLLLEQVPKLAALKAVYARLQLRDRADLSEALTRTGLAEG